MAITEYAMDTTAYSTQSYTAGTIEKRDVSSILDLFDNAQTPFLGYVSWGEPSGANKIEWITEHLGLMYVYNSAAVASTGVTNFVIVSDAVMMDTLTGIAKQIHEGSILYAYSSTDGEHGIMMVANVLSSERAIKVSIQIIEVFVKMRKALTENLNLRLEIEEIKKKLSNQSKNIELVFSYLDELIEKKENLKPTTKIGYNADRD